MNQALDDERRGRRASKAGWRACILLGLLGPIGCAGTPPPRLQPQSGTRPGPPTGTSPGYRWTSREGWKGGTFSLPPDFAPNLDFEGREVIRFAPGFYDPASPGFWNYAFVFLLEKSVMVDAERVETGLADYFWGLGKTLGSKANPGLERSAVEVRRIAQDGPNGQVHLRTYDPWQGVAVQLNGRWSLRPCKGGGRNALIFEFSRAPFEAPIWSTLATETAAFHCK